MIEATDAPAAFGLALSAALAFRSARRLWQRHRRGKWARGMADLARLHTLTPSEFEAYTAAAFERRGWRVEIVGREGRPDGGLDLLLTAKGRRAVVQCKRYKAKVGAPVVREAIGVMMHHRARLAYVVALSGFTRQAREWAKGKPLKLIDGAQLLRVMAAL